MNSDQTSTDQWMPVIAVKPDGNQLFVGWNDRRQDVADNSMIDVYGKFGTIAANGDVQFLSPDFRITTTSFLPVFAGTLAENRIEGHYDPISPPGGVPLDWWYSWWTNYPWGESETTDYVYANEAGEHNGAYANGSYLYVVWSDNRFLASGTKYPARRQADIRLARISWPVQ